MRPVTAHCQQHRHLAMMVDRYLALVVIATLILVPLASFVVDRMRSLPIDLVNASISIILLFVDSSMHFIDTEQHNHFTADDLLIFTFVLIVGIAFTIISIGIYMTIRHERERLGIPAAKPGTPYIEFGYCASLLLSILFLIYSCTVTAAVPTIFGTSDDTLFVTASKLLAFYSNPRRLVEVVTCLYVFFLVLRYWSLVDLRLREWFNKRPVVRPAKTR